MAKYYVNKDAQDNGDHEVHHSNCSWLPDIKNRIDLGECTNCHEAVKKAKNTAAPMGAVTVHRNAIPQKFNNRQLS